MSEVRVRFAPSPTGYLHVGGARTALFNWLYARKNRGSFILRIEDTDYARSSEEMVGGILAGLRWLGLDWDEGPIFQSRRLELYRRAAERLAAAGHAYYCFCPPQLLEERRRQAEAAGVPWKYDRTCLDLSPSEVERRLGSGAPRAIRFKVKEGTTAFDDIVHGRIEVRNEHIEDFVLLRSDRMPTYHLSVVVDDIDMRISHVVRGADHIPNTPKQLMLYSALGGEPPRFAHLPLILGPDKKRLSKRHGATSVLAYRDLGYVPEAVVNFLALLGWSPGGNREILSIGEMIELFRLEDVHKTNAVFDLKKLDWLNSQYISNLPEERLLELARQELERSGLWRDEYAGAERERFANIVRLLAPRIRRLTDFSDWGRAYFSDNFEYDGEAAAVYLGHPGLPELMAELRRRYAELASFDLGSTEAALRGLAAERGVKAGTIIGALRVALTGRSVAPGIFDVIVALGREKTLERIDRLISYLKSRADNKSGG